MEPKIWIKKIILSNESPIFFRNDEIVVIVGPNNSGKSAFLRGIKEKLVSFSKNNKVIRDIEIEKEGTPEELIEWLESNTTKSSAIPSNPQYTAFGSSVHLNTANQSWIHERQDLQGLSRFFCHMLTTDERLKGVEPPASISITKDPLQHPIHFIQRYDALEIKLSDQFRKAFGQDLIVHRNAGNLVPIYVGKRPNVSNGEDLTSYSYCLKVEELPMIQDQGDGMRSFAGVLLYISVGNESIYLVDEPEAFLHPPQARLLGQMIVDDKKSNRQLFIATHSGDFLRGILDANSSKVRVIRIRRSEEVNIACELENAEIKRIWSDSLLRYSNILDGLFHERVVLCEGDSDCRFYAAVVDSLYESNNFGPRKPDVMFTHCGGKGRLPMVIRSLKKLNVPISVVVDFDVFIEEGSLRNIMEATGGNWNYIRGDWNTFKSYINSKDPELTTEKIKEEIRQIFDNTYDQFFPESSKKEIQKILRRSSPWSIAKSEGISFINREADEHARKSAVQTCSHLLQALETQNIFVVPVGELEGFDGTVPNHGPSWVNEVLSKNLQTDPALSAAREFVANVIGEWQFKSIPVEGKVGMKK